jgi:hypothetical protein
MINKFKQKDAVFMFYFILFFYFFKLRGTVKKFLATGITVYSENIKLNERDLLAFVLLGNVCFNIS